METVKHILSGVILGLLIIIFFYIILSVKNFKKNRKLDKGGKVK